MLTHDSARRNAAVSPLLRLPAEIRSIIYSTVLKSHKFLTSRLNQYLDKYGTTYVKYRTLLKLLLVCREIYFESRLLVFGLNVVSHINSDEHLKWMERQWCAEQRAAVRALYFYHKSSK